MSYLVLARKYRPRRFADVVGQEVATGVLRGAIEEDRVGHAYLFCGPRGTGKTTTARIFSKALNCERGPTADPCGECDRCTAADAGAEADIVEIDAASHTGVDNIRELRDQAAYAPMRARYKVYIIDEVHMLSKGAFNALLKTLEEPPPHVKFLFATTEPHRVPDTILSRCQVLRLSPIDESRIAARLTEVAEAEGLRPGPGVLEELARRARGGMRDALSLTDQLLSLVGSEPTLDDVLKLGGESGAREIDRLLGLVEEGRRGELLAALPAEAGGELELLNGVLDHLRACLVSALCGADTPLLAGIDTERALARAQRLGADRLEVWIRELLAARERMRWLVGQERLVLEMALFELARPEATVPLAELEERLFALERRLEAAASPAASAAPSPAASAAPSTGAPPPAAPGSPRDRIVPAPPPPADAAARPAPPAPRARPATPAGTPAGTPAAARADAAPAGGRFELWKRALDELAGTHGALADVLRRRGRLQSGDGERVVVELPGLTDDERPLVDDRRNRAALARVLAKAAGREVELDLASGGGSAPAPPADRYTRRVADLFGGVIEDDG